MYSFLSEISLATDQDSDNADGEITDKSGVVTLMTVHAAKGLEFKHVYIVGLEEELFPSAMTGGIPDAIEEERRLMYVAITRAEKTAVPTLHRRQGGIRFVIRTKEYIPHIQQQQHIPIIP